ncbi:MAG: hypothetical protein K2H46_11305, partial [Muribaculaceae bacterium]|nr:hypothetical protein [Muribaculaceae bacterium]
MAKIKIIDNVLLKERSYNFRPKQIDITALDLPFYIVINQKSSSVFLNYEYLTQVVPLQRLDTDELSVYFGQYSGRITKLELKIQNISDANWRYLREIFKDKYRHNTISVLN